MERRPKEQASSDGTELLKLRTSATQLQLGNGNAGGYITPFTVGQQASAGGQVQLVELKGAAQTLEVFHQQCNSTYLGFTFHEQYYPGDSPIKLKLASDTTKCVQRHAALHSNNPSGRTHLTIEPCSDIDNADQARQFFNFYNPYGEITSIYKRNGKIGNYGYATSKGSPNAILVGDEKNVQPAGTHGYPPVLFLKS
ncbi:hypothetical protein CBOM_05192 [Ceraceosorus bombacis]|uniref:Ricin B lectin domain-containing protein n=1 Tax=Ceraceosorus bombacis TaxID=401625 RepID=A0A0P1BJA2_9BASI|nr:hypothetical protein CBOM_05192 [Ceraceosorus bombacis]